MNTEQFDGHTPGPWAFYTMGADEPHHSVQADGWGTWGIQTPITHGADARLIAAAPDLLAALIKEREENARLRRQNDYLWEHRSSHWSADDDAEMDRLEVEE